MRILFKEEIILKTKKITVGQDREVPIPGFFILSPNRKLRSIDEFSENELQEFGLILADVRRGMRKVLGIEDVYLFQNEDTGGNFHLRIFPRHQRMEQFGRKIESIKPIMEWSVKNMNNNDTIKEIKDYVSKMKEYLNK